METGDIIYFTVVSTIAALSIAGNSLILLAIVRHHHLHNITNMLIGNLAIADGLTGLIVMPLSMMGYKGLPRGFYPCTLASCAQLVFMYAGRLTLLVITLERFIAIKFPFVYLELTTKNAICAVAISWLLAAAFGLIPLYAWTTEKFEVQSCVFTEVINLHFLAYLDFPAVAITGVVMFAIYVYILIVVVRLKKRTIKQRKLVASPEEVLQLRVYDAKTFMLFSVVLAHNVMDQPLTVVNAVDLFTDLPIPKQLLFFLIVLGHSKACLDPILCIAGSKKIRRAIKRMFGYKPMPSVIRLSLEDRKSHGRSHTVSETRSSPPLDFDDIEPETRLSGSASLAESRLDSLVPSAGSERDSDMLESKRDIKETEV